MLSAVLLLLQLDKRRNITLRKQVKRAKDERKPWQFIINMFASLMAVVYNKQLTVFNAS